MALHAPKYSFEFRVRRFVDHVPERSEKEYKQLGAEMLEHLGSCLSLCDQLYNHGFIHSMGYEYVPDYFFRLLVYDGYGYCVRYLPGDIRDYHYEEIDAWVREFSGPDSKWAEMPDFREV